MDTQSLIAAIGGMAGLAGAVTALLALLRAPLEALPWAKPGSAFHDLTLQITNFLLNLGGLLLFGTATGQLQLNGGQSWALVVCVALLQALGSHVSYTTVKAAVVTSQAASGLAAGAKTEAPVAATGSVADWPPADATPAA